MPRPDSERRSKWPAVVSGIVFLLPVLYVLSAGPMNWFVITGRVSPETTMKIYAPLVWVAGSRTPPGDALNWYIGLFEPDYSVL